MVSANNMKSAASTGVYKRAADVSKSHLSGASFRKPVLKIVQNQQVAKFLENRKQCRKIG